LNITEGVRRLTNHSGNALVALLADACWPLDRSALADLAVPVGAHLREIVGEDERRTASIRTIHRQNRLVRQADAGVVLRDAAVVPLVDLAEVDVGDDVAREVQILVDTGDVIDRDNRAENGG